MRRKSRLYATRAKKSQRTVALSILGIILILFVLFKFGLDALINFSLFVTGHGENQSTQSLQNNLNYLSPPTLNPLPTATNSAQIVISGFSKKKSTVILYINNSLKDQMNIKTDGTFSFTENLSSGTNIIEVKAKLETNESDFSNQFNVSYNNNPPKLDIKNPSDGQSFNKNQVGTGNSIVVTGQTDANVTVTVNEFYAVLDENNNFSYTFSLQNGDNQLKIIAKDQAGNTTEKDLKVSFSQ